MLAEALRNILKPHPKERHKSYRDDSFSPLPDFHGSARAKEDRERNSCLFD
jgi:hypothetical protein